MAGWYWRDKLKEWYNLSQRTQKNLSICRASTTNRTLLNDFYAMVENLLTKLDLKDKPSHIWNWVGTCVTYIITFSNTVCQVGRKYVYKQSSGDKCVTTTLLCCMCASGMSILPMVIFKGVRLNEQLAETSMPSLVCLLPKGWISADIFAEWFQHLIKCIPSHRPVVLFMDSHASHITPKILSKASEKGIHLVTFPSHTTQLQQPLDVGVYKPLNDGWRKEVEKFLTEHPGAKPGCYDFNGLLASAYHGTFQSTTVCFSCLWAKHDVGWPGRILLKWYFHCLGKQNNPHVHIHH